MLWEGWERGRGYFPTAPPLQLERALDTGMLGPLGSPGGFTLSTLQGPSSSLSPLEGRTILCILGALLAKRGACWAGVGRKRAVRHKSLQRPLPHHPAQPQPHSFSLFRLGDLLGGVCAPDGPSHSHSPLIPGASRGHSG